MQRRHSVSTDTAGLLTVGAGSLLISSTVALLPIHMSDQVMAWTLAAIMAGLAIVGFLLKVATRDRLLPAFYPLVIFGGLAYIGSHSPVVGQAYGGLFTISFVFIGLTMPRGSAAVLAAPAAACWWLTYAFGDVPASLLVIRLVIAMAIWVGIAEILARRSVRARAERLQLLDDAEQDPLTRLQNRRSLPEIYAACRPGDVFVIVDFDHFKAVNDNYGHDAGDKVLVDFSDTLRRVLRHNDTAIRYGGEEILIHLRQPGREIAAILSRLREAWWRESPVTTYSAGAAVVEVEEQVSAAIKRADRYLYMAKDNGRNQDVLSGELTGYSGQIPSPRPTG